MSFSVVRRCLTSKVTKIHHFARSKNVHFCNRRLFSSSIDVDSSSGSSSGIGKKDDKREMNIEFLLSLFQNLHSRNLTDVMSETLSEFELSKEQTMTLLHSETFLKLNQHIVIALLENDAIIRDNIESHHLWAILKEWSVKNTEISPPPPPPGVSDNILSSIKFTSSSRNNSNSEQQQQVSKDREWLKVMKIFLPYIKFEEMDARFFMKEIECIPDECGIISKDRKYHIVRQHCFNLIEEKQIRDTMIANKLTDHQSTPQPIPDDFEEKGNVYKRLDRLD